jgi:hypothetical protein
MLALFLFLLFRFVAQLSAVVPCAPGFLWPRGALFGAYVPSILVDYHPANDMFFSGHTGSLLVAAIEFFEMDYAKTAWLHFVVLLPCVSTLVVSFRVHRGMDCVAAVFAAVAATGAAATLAEPIDRLCSVLRHNAGDRSVIKVVSKND